MRVATSGSACSMNQVGSSTTWASASWTVATGWAAAESSAATGGAGTPRTLRVFEAFFQSPELVAQRLGQPVAELVEMLAYGDHLGPPLVGVDPKRELDA